MISGNPSEELTKQKECETATGELRDTWDSDWAITCLDSSEYEIPLEEGKWENVVSNRAKAVFYKMVDYLEYSQRKLWIPIKKEDREGRKDLTRTEDLAKYCIWLADNEESDLPLHQDSQSLFAFYRVQRGWSAKRYILRDEDGKLVSDMAHWDPRNTYWLNGKKRLVWVCYVNYRTKEEILDEYPGWNGSVGIPGADGNSNLGSKLTAVYDIWAVEQDKEAEEAVIIGSEYVKEPVKIGLDYLPISITPGRAVPLISDGRDNIKYVGEGYLHSIRQTVVTSSKLMTFLMDSASKQARAPIVIEFDGTGGAKPPSFGGNDPDIKNRVIYLDVSKKQKVAERLTPPSIDQILNIWNIIQNELSVGSISPVGWGIGNQALTAQGTDILRHATMESLNSSIRGIERDYVWWAQEIARQFKNGDFTQYEIEGRDPSDNPYPIKNLSPKDIDDNWRFKCELVPDLLRDKSAHLAWLVTAVQNEIISVEEARDLSQIVTDPDATSEKISRQKANKLFNLEAVGALIAKIHDFGKKPTLDDQLYLAQMAKVLQQLTMPQPENQPGNQPDTMPVKENNNLLSVPDNIRQAALTMGGNNARPV